MKRYLLAVMGIVIQSLASNAQHAQNINPTLSPYGNGYWPPNCWSMYPSQTPGWDISHGNPHVVAANDGARCLIVEDQGGYGHGVLIPFAFEQWTQYSIVISLCDDRETEPVIDNHLINGSLLVKLTENKPFNRTLSGCGDYIPATSSLGWVMHLASLSDPFNHQFTKLDLATSNIQMNYLWLYPLRTKGGPLTKAFIKSVHIYKRCINEMVLTGNFIVPKRYDHIKNIFAGSSYGSTSIAATNPIAPTEFIASESILISQNFIAHANENSYFLASIDPEMCGELNSQEKRSLNSDNGQYVSLTESVNDQLQTQKSAFENVYYKNIDIFPNPVSDEINITYPSTSSGELQVVVRDINGRAVYKEKVVCKNKTTVKHTVNAKDFLPGIYLVELTMNDEHIIRKVVKQ